VKERRVPTGETVEERYQFYKEMYERYAEMRER
jgi:hypothetical protein